MEIEVGEYTKSISGEIDKVDALYGMIENTVHLEKHKWQNVKNIVKHSKNIIDLIEDKDIVTLEYYVSKYRKRIQRKFEVETLENDICFLNNRCSFLYDREKQKFIDGEAFNPKIVSIVTHEQFSNIEYKVEE